MTDTSAPYLEPPVPRGDYYARAEPFWKKIGHNDGEGYFSLAKASNPSEFIPEDQRDLRCDAYRTVGPIGFHRWDDARSACVCGRLDRPQELTGQHEPSMSGLKAFYPVIEALPFGFILYSELHDLAAEEALLVAPFTHHTRTLQEMIRYVLEWDFAYTDLGNREEIAEVCHGVTTVLAIPDDLRDWVIQSVPPEKVGRFLAGHPNARARTTEPIPDMTIEFWAWIAEKATRCRSFGEFS